MRTILSTSATSKLNVFNALCELLKTERLDSISVRQICERAQVGKTTFYAHFQDKYDVILWYSDLAHEVGVGQIGRTLTWEEGHRLTTEAILAEREVLNRGAESRDVNSVIYHSSRWREGSLARTLTEYRHVELTQRLKYQISALAAGEIAIASHYFNAKDRIPLKDYIDTLISIVPRELYELLATPLNLPGEEEENRRRMLELTILQMQRR
ncbi:MAG: TetR family transcriptional regulator [Coriobacteriales bacterium]